MCEERHVWSIIFFSTMGLDAGVYNDTENIKQVFGNFPTIFIMMYRRKLKGKMETQGIGKHSQEEVFQLGELQMKAISDFLGMTALLPPTSAVEVMESDPFVCLSIWDCETYVVHHLVSTGLCCAPSTCIVHHQPALYTWKNCCGRPHF